jgi:methanogenic corrinoid protein MtbC1
MDPFLELNLNSLADRILERYYRSSDAPERDLDTFELERNREDTLSHLNHLAVAIQMDSPNLFQDYLRWLKLILSPIGVHEDAILENLKLVREMIVEEIGEGRQSVAFELIDDAKKQYPSETNKTRDYIEEGSNHSKEAKMYLELLLEGKEVQAEELVLDLARSGVEIKDIYNDIFLRVQRQMGELWQSHDVSVYQEHYTTQATIRIMSQLIPYLKKKVGNGRKMVSACAPGEIHDLGMRMISDRFMMEGWDTFYLGANTPPESLASVVKRRKPDILAISSTLSTNLIHLEKTISEVKERCGDDTPKIIVGGKPFQIDSKLWKKVGADAMADNAEEAFETVNSLVR